MDEKLTTAGGRVNEHNMGCPSRVQSNEIPSKVNPEVTYHICRAATIGDTSAELVLVLGLLYGYNYQTPKQSTYNP